MDVVNSKVTRHLDICNELNALYAKKNHDYGDSFHQTFVEEGFAMSRIRLADKFNRFKTLSRGSEALVGDESIRDTLIDLANYAVMTALEMDDAAREARLSAEVDQKPETMVQGNGESYFPHFDTQSDPSITYHFDILPDGTSFHRYRVEGANEPFLYAARQFAISGLDGIEAYKKNEVSVTEITVNTADNVARFNIIIKTTVPDHIRTYVETGILSRIQKKDLEEYYHAN